MTMRSIGHCIYCSAAMFRDSEGKVTAPDAEYGCYCRSDGDPDLEEEEDELLQEYGE